MRQTVQLVGFFVWELAVMFSLLGRTSGSAIEPNLLAQITEVPASAVEELCAQLAREYEDGERGFVLVRVAGGYRFQSHPDLAAYDFTGLRVSILGDISHSRVARSNIHGLRALGAEVTLCGPRTMIPVGIEGLGVRVTDRLDEALEGCDVAMALRIQLERQEAGLFPSLREYHERFGIKMEHLERRPDLLVMHPGPVNRGVELASEVVDHERAIILDQVTNGVAVRMAVLYLLSGLPEEGRAE